MPFLNKIINLASTADNSTSNQTLPYESSQSIGSQVRNWPGNKRLKRENKENHSLVIRGRRSRKQSRPMRLIWNQEPMGNGKTRTIPSLGRLEAIAQNISPRVTQDTAEEISPDISQQQQNIAQDVSRDIAQDVAEDISPDISRQQENDNVQNIAQDVSRDISQDVAEDISPGTSRQQENDNVQNITQDVSRDISQDVAEDISPGTSQQQQNNKMENARNIFCSLREISKNVTISDATRDNPLPNVRMLKSVRKIRQQYQQRQKKLFKCILCWKNKRSFSRFFERRALILHKLIYH